MSTPTQVRRPWRSTVRTAFQVAVGLATIAPLVVADVYADPDAYPAVVAQTLAVTAAAARVMANPAVETFLARFAPWLAADPLPAGGEHRAD